MEIFFQDPSEIPLPPEEVRIRELRAEPWPDGRRVRIYLEVDPFQKRPSAEVHIENEEGEDVAQASILESMSRKMEFTLHLRQPDPQGTFRLSAVLYFTSPLPVSGSPESEHLSEVQAASSEIPEPVVVDRAETKFVIPSGSQKTTG